jgi:hypothetical protein
MARPRSFTRPARFDHQSDEQWQTNAWSLLVDLDGQPDARDNQRGRAWFLMPNAPHDWLTEGAQFTILDGRIALAEGRVVRGAVDES